jgi:hypothetical protein
MSRLHRIALLAAVIAAACALSACGKPADSALRDSFAQQLAANRFVKDFQRSGDDLRFSGPGPDGKDRADWRVHIDTAVVEPNDDSRDTAHPYKGTVTSSWYADGQIVKPRGADSNLPIELTSNGLAQECWALWDTAAKRWSWE